MGYVKAILDILASVLGIARKRNEDANTAPMKARAEAQNAVKADDATAKAIAARDLEQLRKDASE
jgi:hypothetical protein